MVLVGLSTIFTFKCKWLYRLGIPREILEKTIDCELSLFLDEFHVSCTCYVHILHKVLAQSMLSTMAAGEASQTAPVHNYGYFRFALFYTNCVYNFDSCKSLTCYMVCIN